MKLLFTRMLAALAGSLALVAGDLAVTAVPARAAMGEFTFKRVGQAASGLITDPRSFLCSVLADTAQPLDLVVNHTNSTLWVFSTGDCREGSQTLVRSGDRLELDPRLLKIAVMFVPEL